MIARYKLSVICCVAIAAATVPARAAIVSYDFNGTLVDASNNANNGVTDGTISGSFAIDTVTDAVTALSYGVVASPGASQVTSQTYSPNPAGSAPYFVAANGDDDVDEGFTVGSAGEDAEINLEFPAGGGPLSSAGFAHSYFDPEFVTGADDQYIDDGTASLAPISATPLPAALSLFAGGLGMVGFFARRKKRRGHSEPAPAKAVSSAI